MRTQITSLLILLAMMVGTVAAQEAVPTGYLGIVKDWSSKETQLMGQLQKDGAVMIEYEKSILVRMIAEVRQINTELAQFAEKSQERDKLASQLLTLRIPYLQASQAELQRARDIRTIVYAIEQSGEKILYTKANQLPDLSSKQYQQTLDILNSRQLYDQKLQDVYAGAVKGIMVQAKLDLGEKALTELKKINPAKYKELTGEK